MTEQEQILKALIALESSPMSRAMDQAHLMILARGYNASGGGMDPSWTRVGIILANAILEEAE